MHFTTFLPPNVQLLQYSMLETNSGDDMAPPTNVGEACPPHTDTPITAMAAANASLFWFGNLLSSCRAVWVSTVWLGRAIQERPNIAMRGRQRQRHGQDRLMLSCAAALTTYTHKGAE